MIPVHHRCIGCGHTWTGGDRAETELCGDCWRVARPVLHQPVVSNTVSNTMSHGETPPEGRYLTDRERDILLLALVREAQRQHRPFGYDEPCCIVCAASFRTNRHAPTCALDRGMERVHESRG